MDTTAVSENSCKYLTSLVNTNLVTRLGILSSYYLTKCKKLEQQGLIKSSLQFNSNASGCSLCYIPHSSLCTKYQIKPAQKNGRFLRRLFAKKKASTEYQRKAAQKLANKHAGYNKMVMTCGNCRKEAVKPLRQKHIYNLTAEKPKNNTMATPLSLKKRFGKKGKHRTTTLSQPEVKTPISNNCKTKTKRKMKRLGELLQASVNTTPKSSVSQLKEFLKSV